MAAALADRPGRPLHDAAPVSTWSLGVDRIDGQLPAGGLAVAGLHEIKPGGYRDSPAAIAFAVMLAVRRMCSPSSREDADATAAGSAAAKAGQRARPRPVVLWVMGGAAAHEHGRPYGPGLARFGLDPASLLLVEARRQADALWAMEEGLRSGVPAIVIGCIDGLDALQSRRLVLAAGSSAIPCLALTGHASPPGMAAYSRWRVTAAAGATHPLDPAAPGALRLGLTLERCRHGPSGLVWSVEWCDETHRLGLASELAAGAAGAPGARVGAR